ncbi:GRAM domain-containing protein [Haematococcus lacustris]|uniref:GRAM domain-containing protein n=1 Tax=Haematococcus lacustris TaxID=44745 RepID=A0A699YX29_HAELA|nr:GRAM domain-containing protein [Haematococcus lacustris]
MAFQGSLYVTEKHVCFSVEERGRQLPLKIPLQDITAASRQLPAQKGGSDLLRLELAPGSTGAAGTGPLPRHLAFKDFSAEPGSLGGPAGPSSGLSSGGALDSALALIEHLTEAEEEG